MAKALTNVVFAGRLGSYKYIDMHQAIGAALRIYEKRVLPFLKTGTADNVDTAEFYE